MRKYCEAHDRNYDSAFGPVCPECAANIERASEDSYLHGLEARFKSVCAERDGYASKLQACEKELEREGERFTEMFAAANGDCARRDKQIADLQSRLDKTEKSEDGWRTQAMGMSKRVIELESRLETYRKAAIFRDNGYDVCRFCRHRTHMGQEIPHDDYCPLVVEKHEPN